MLDTSIRHLGLVVPDHLLQTHTHRPPRLPVERLFGSGSVGPPLLRVISRHRLVDNLDASRTLDAVFILDLLHNLPHEFGEFTNGELVAVSDVDRPRLVRVHERDETVDEVVDVLERARLRAVAVHGHVLAPKSLDDEIGNNASVGWIHWI